MSNQQITPLTTYVERARKVLQFEQRTNHQDRAIKPGGLEAFISRWYDETSTICKNTGLDLGPIHRFVEHLEGYHQQDPMLRAASLRAALATLNELDGHGPQHDMPTTVQTTQATSNGKNVRQSKVEPPIVHSVLPAEPTKTGPTTSQQNSNSLRLDTGMSQGHTVLALLTADITAVPGVGPTVAKRLQHLGIRTIRDLLFYFPREHRDYSKLVKIAHIPFGEVTTTMGLVWDVKTLRTGNGRTRTIAEISDETGKLSVSWFNQAYLQKQLQTAKGEYLVVTGVKQRFGNKVEFSVRSHELPERGDLLNTGRLVPIYPLTEGLHAKSLLRFTKYVVDRYAQMVPEHLPMSIRTAGQLLPLPEAVTQMHYPENEEMRATAHHRLAFDELFMI